MRILGLITLCLSLIACGKPSDPNTLKVGAIAGPEAELVQLAGEVAHQSFGLTVKVVEFNDYNLPNAALEDGSLDANVYQHMPYLQGAIKAHDYHLEPIGKTFIYPMAVYSNRFKTIAALPERAIVAIPNDPSNESRALLLLAKADLIELKPTQQANIHDIVKNPKHLQLKELDAAQLPRVLNDVDAAVINTTYAMPAGLTHSHDAIFIEDKDSPYVNLIVVKKNNPKMKQLKQLIHAFHSQQVQDKAKELFGESAVAAW